jgi:hypothetical protein
MALVTGDDAKVTDNLTQRKERCSDIVNSISEQSVVLIWACHGIRQTEVFLYASDHQYPTAYIVTVPIIPRVIEIEPPMYSCGSNDAASYHRSSVWRDFYII